MVKGFFLWLHVVSTTTRISIYATLRSKCILLCTHMEPKG